MRFRYRSEVIRLFLLCCILTVFSKSVQSDEPPAISMAQLKAKFDKTEKLVRIQNKATGKFLTYMPAAYPISPTSGEFVDVKLQDQGSQTWILRETLGFPYTRNDSFTRLNSIRPSEKLPGTPKSTREFSNSLWKIDLIGEDFGRPFFRLRNTFSQACLTVLGPNFTNVDLRDTVEYTVQSKTCPQDGAAGAEDYSLFYLRF